jgi:hypothetical protein
MDSYNWLIYLLIVYILVYSIEPMTVSACDLQDSTSLRTHGFTCVQLNSDATFKDIEIKQIILSYLPSSYVMLDYSYQINGCSLSTFHRDVTSSKSSLKTKYTTFTAIWYLYDGEMVSLCKYSNNSMKPFTFTRPTNIRGEKNTIVIFDCDILHAGMLNSVGMNRHVIQFKMAHRDDLSKLSHLQNLHVAKRTSCENEMNLPHRFRRYMSYMFSGSFEYVFKPMMIKKYDNDTFYGQLQNAIPIQFYNNA